MSTYLAVTTAAFLVLFGLAAGDAVAGLGLFIPGSPAILAVCGALTAWAARSEDRKYTGAERRHRGERRAPVRPHPSGHLFSPWPNKPDECTYCWQPRPGHVGHPL